MTTTIDVSTAADFRTAIATIDAAPSGSDYLIRLDGNTGVDAPLPAISEAAGVTTTIDGGGFTLDGGGTYQGLFVYSGVLTVENLTIANMVAPGGNGVNGGGGAGLGGGLFVAGTNGSLSTGGTVTLSNVTLSGNSAIGGAGADLRTPGNGGSMSGATLSLGLGGIGDSSGDIFAPGFGGGGATVGTVGGGGGFGGGGGGVSTTSGGGGGFGAGRGGSLGGGGGGGLGAGGDIFVQQGGTLVIAGGALSDDDSVTSGAGASGGVGGSAFGASMFLQGNQTITLAPGPDETLIVAGAIADQFGSGGTGGNAGAAGILAGGGGRIVFSAVNTYTGTTSLGAATTLELGASASADNSNLAFTGNATLLLDALSATFADVTGLPGRGTCWTSPASPPARCRCRRARITPQPSMAWW